MFCGSIFHGMQDSIPNFHGEKIGKYRLAHHLINRKLTLKTGIDPQSVKLIEK